MRHKQSVVYIPAAHAHGGATTLTAVLPQLTLASTRSCLFRDVCCLQVFLDFISYSGGPLPEDLLEVIKVPVVIAWGDQDPWEPIEQGRAFADFDSVEVKREKAQQATWCACRMRFLGLREEGQPLCVRRRMYGLFPGCFFAAPLAC